MNLAEAPIRPQNIDVRYDGMFSEYLTWNLGVLAHTEQVVDLRSSVIIKAGNERPQIDTTNLGDILAWKGLGDPKEMFRKQKTGGREYEVRDYIDSEGRAEILINDQVLSHRIRHESANKLDEQKFTASLNSFVASGLWQIATQEKWVTTRNTLRYLHIPFLGLSAFSGSIGGGAFALSRWAIRSMSLDNAIFVAPWGIIAGFGFSFISVYSLHDWAKTMHDTIKSDFKYLTSYGDFNPLKKLVDAVHTSLYFFLSKPSFVTYEK